MVVMVSPPFDNPQLLSAVVCPQAAHCFLPSSPLSGGSGENVLCRVHQQTAAHSPAAKQAPLAAAPPNIHRGKSVPGELTELR